MSAPGDTVDAGGAGLGITATESEDVLAIAAGIAIGADVGVAGSAAVNVLTETTKAYIGVNSTVIADRPAA